MTPPRPILHWRRPLVVAGIGGVALALTVGLLASAVRGADDAAARAKAAACAACHGADGNGTIPGTPSIAAMPPWFTHWQLIMYRDGRRKDPQMSPLIANMSDADMGELSAFYAGQKATARPASVDAARVAAGRTLAQTHNCLSCHGPGLMGQNLVPRVAGQDFAYLKQRLAGYKTKTASDLDGMMTMVAQALSDEDVDNLVHFMASVEPQ
jgi:cytochrome c553